MSMYQNHGRNGRTVLRLVCVSIVVFGTIVETQSFGQIFSGLSFNPGKTLGDLARQKIADLHNLRSQLESKRLQKQSTNTNTNKENNNNKNSASRNMYSSQKASLNDGNRGKGMKNNMEERVLSSLPLPASLPIPMPGLGLLSSFRSIFSMKKSRDGFLSRILPNAEVLRKIIRMRNEMNPSLREYLTSKYNNFLSTLTPYSDNIGIPAYVLNSMKMSDNNQDDTRWQIIEKLLETSSVEDLIQNIPDFSSILNNKYYSQNLNLNQNQNSVDDEESYEPLQSRMDEQDLVSDQEPDALIKGHKKKYTSYGIRLGGRKTRPHKGDLASSTSSVIGPERTGYEYMGSSYADQYALYGHDSYDTYGDTKGHDHGHQAYGHGTSHKGHGHGGSSSSYGQSTYYSPKGYSSGHSSGYGYGSSGGGGGHGGGGHGGGGGMMGGFLDPFSILGTLAFLTYLGLLFQQSMAPAPVNMTGRAFPDDTDPLFGRRKREIEVTFLNFDTDASETSSKDNDRHIRSIEGAFENTEYMAPNILEDTWKEIRVIEKIQETSCREEKLCQLVQDIGNTALLNIFKDELEKSKRDRKFIRELFYKSKTSDGITCGLRISLDCDYKID